MSTCISHHGEYSNHEPGDWCPRCGAFNEVAIVAERDQLRATVQRVEALTSSNSGDYEHNGHPTWEGEPECPGCWVDSIRVALAGDDGGDTRG